MSTLSRTPASAGRRIDVVSILRFPAILAVGVMAGFFWSFSVVVMPGLAATDPVAALSSMQAINLAVRNPMFGIGFFGALALSALTVLGAATRRRDLSAWIAAAGGAVYILGVLLPTGGFNVPLNESLAVVDPASPGSAAAMTAYIRDWSYWNDIRTTASLTALALLTAGLMLARIRVGRT